MRLILVGPPGSGKGTQAQRLCKEFGLAHIATGDMFREAIKLGTPAGQRAEPYVLSGKLVPNELVNELVADCFRSDDRPEKFLLDGYPRTADQAAALDAVLRQQFLNIDAVVVLLVDFEEIIRRVSGRWICPKCQAPYHEVSKPPRVPGVCDLDGVQLIQRADDREDTIRQRLKVNNENTEGVVAHYRKQGLVREVPAEGDIDTVYHRIVQVLPK